jgi:hypothetical protein
MNPVVFEKLIKGLSSDEIISAAIECGLLENKNIFAGYEATIPHWLAEIFARHGIIEIVEAKA